jgi:hypothetical protein
MPIMTPGPTAPSTILPIVPQVTDDAYVGVVVDTRYTPRASLVTYVDGANWTINYYSQVIDQSNDLSPQQADRPGSYQQYALIQSLIVKVSQALSTSQDAESKSMELAGSATVLPGLIPNKGDMFLADTGDGREGLFVVTDSVKKSFLKDTVYDIEYVLTNYATQGLLKDLNAKVIQTSTFVEGNLLIGKSPILASSAYTDLQLFQKQYQLLMNQYFGTFYSHEFQTLLVPDQGQGLSVYDSFLVHAILSWITTDEHPMIQRIKAWNVDGDLAMKAQTVWDALSQMNVAVLPMVCQQMAVCNTAYFTRYAFFNGIYFSGMASTIYPMDSRTDVDAGYIPYITPGMGPLGEGNTPYRELHKLLSVQTLPGFSYNPVGSNVLPDIIPVTTDEYYVFSQGFYSNPAIPASNMELVTLQALNGEAIDPVVLHRLCNNAVAWNNLERFYYVPVLMAILKTLIGVL